VRKLLASGRVQINGRVVKKSARVRAADVVEVLDLPRGPVPLPAEGEVAVAFEDEDLAVVEKPAGMPTHPLTPEETGTLINLTVHRWPQTRGLGPRTLEPGLIHRLDTLTSGLVMIALNQRTFDALRRDLKMGRIRKIYRARVHGVVERNKGEIKVPLAKSSSDAGLMVPATPGHKFRGRALPALSRFRVLERGSNMTLVELELVTGVRHQLRAHLAFIGHPVIGDDRYGPPERGDLRGYALQASQLSLTHPVKQERMEVAARTLLTLSP
jgi:23S rRNA pseudouridine1911/1915/1917 synthase